MRHFHLTLSWRRPLLYRNQSIDLQSKNQWTGFYMITVPIMKELNVWSVESEVLPSMKWVGTISSIKYSTLCWKINLEYQFSFRVDDNKERNYYSLHWTCTFPNESDTYYFAHSYPYTYTDLQVNLRDFSL